MIVIQVEQLYKIEEIADYVDQQLGRLADFRVAYDWLPYCLIPNPKVEYSERDLKKFLFIAAYLYIKRSLPAARQLLEADIQAEETKHLYQKETTVDEFLRTHPVIRRAQRIRNRRQQQSVHARGGSRSQRKQNQQIKEAEYEILETTSA
jgi:hypothetical protein